MIRWDTSPEFLSDAELLEAYKRASGELDDQGSEALLAKIAFSPGSVGCG